MPRSVMAHDPVTETLESSLPVESKLGILGGFARDFRLRSIALSTVLLHVVSGLEALTVQVDKSPTRGIRRNDSTIIRVRQLLYSWNKQRDALLDAPSLEEYRLLGLAVARQVLLELPIKSGQDGFEAKAAAIRGIIELEKLLDVA